MNQVITFLSQSWPWWVSGPLIGLLVPVLLLTVNKEFGISSTFRHICAATLPGQADYLRYNWRKEGGWQIALAVGAVLGGAVAVHWLSGAQLPQLTPAAKELFARWGAGVPQGFEPTFFTDWSQALSLRGLLSLCLGGFLVGFGTRWANGCTSGHAIMGLSLMNIGSFVAVIGFFVGGTLASWFLVPLILSL